MIRENRSLLFLTSMRSVIPELIPAFKTVALSPPSVLMISSSGLRLWKITLNGRDPHNIPEPKEEVGTRDKRERGRERIFCTCKPLLGMAEDSWNAGNLFISGRILRTRQALISGQVVRPWLGGCRRGRGSFFMTPLPKAFRLQQPFEDPWKAVEKLVWQQTHHHHIFGAGGLSSAAASLSIPSNFWGILLLRPYQRTQIWNVTEGNLKDSLAVLWTKHHSAEMSSDAGAFPLVLNVHHYFIQFVVIVCRRGRRSPPVFERFPSSIPI